MGTAWIIDAGYAHSLQRSAGRDFDYVKFKKKLCDLAGETIRETYYLTTVPDVPDPDLAERLIRDAESKRWLVPEIGLTYEHYVPELGKRQERITKR